MPAPTTSAAAARTPAEIRAGAHALFGDRSRSAQAATGDQATPPPPEDAGTVGELWLYGVVGGWWRGFDAESVANALRGLDVDTLYVRIHSPGGLASDGIAIGNLLRNHSARVVVVVDGIAASAASVIAVAGDEIVMCPGSQLMLHDASTVGYGNAADLRRAADWVDGQSANYAGVYAYKAGGTAALWREVMLANDGWGTWYTAEEAVSAGLADSVGTRPAVGSPPTAPEDELEEELDDDETLARAAHDLALLDQCVHPAARAAWQGERPKPPTASADGSITTQEGSTAVAFTDAQLTTMRQELGLPEDADEATIVAALSEALAEQAEETTSSTAATPPEGMVLVESDVLDDLRSAAAMGKEARTQQLNEKRDRTIAQAIADGKITPARREHWAMQWDADPEGAEQTLNALAAGLVPVEERGHDQGAAAGGVYDELYSHESQKGA